MDEFHKNSVHQFCEEFKQKVMNKFILGLMIGLMPYGLIAQITLIPDTNFENRLIWLGLDNAPLNGQVPTANIDTLRVLGIQSQNITDLTGIQDFTALEELYGNWNALTTIDVSQNINLKKILLIGNQLTSLDVSNNPLLEELDCWNNQLTSINLIGADSLKIIWCTSNQLTSIDFSQNTLLTQVVCYQNQITSLDFSQNSNLYKLQCQNNPLTSLNVSGASALSYLACNNSNLTTLDVSQNPLLTRLDCDFNQLTSLNVTGAISLDTLRCNSNQITSLNLSQNPTLTVMNLGFNNLNCLNLKNGNNVNIEQVLAISNPNLVCVEVDDTAYANANWPAFDAGVSFSTNCNNSCSNTQANINKNNFSNISLYPNPTTGNFSIDLDATETNPKVTLSSSLGLVILAQEFESTDFINIDIDAPKGIYFLQIETTRGETKTLKVIKE